MSSAISAIKGKWAWNPLTIAVLGIAVILFGTILLWVLYNSNIDASDPSEADARKVFENQREERLKDGLAEILTFKKVNAESQEILGVRLYIVEYEAEIRYPNKDQTEKVEGRITFKMTDKGWLGEDGKFH